jgi:SPP1 family predicted phage head-tail adaptor
MRAGSLDRPIIFERASNVVDDAGRVTETWSRLAIRRAEIVHDETSDTTGDAGAVTSNVIRFRTRYMADLTLADRIGYGGNVYTIHNVVEIGRRRGLEITAKRVGP